MRRLLSLCLLAAACAGRGDADDSSSKDASDDSDDVVETDSDVHTDSDVDTDDTDASPVHVPATLTSSGVQRCTEPAQRETALFDIQEVTYPPVTRVYLSGGGSALGDVTGDGLPDIVLVTHQQVTLHAQRAAGGFEPPVVLLRQPLAGDFTGLFGGTLVDVEDDGDLDLFVTARGLPNALLLNDGAGGFTDGTVAAGLVDPPGHHSTSSSWSDFDGDGDLDVFVAGHGWVDEEAEIFEFGPGDPSFLYANDGDGTFTDVSHLLPEHLAAGYSFIGGWFDADDDGDDDLYVINDFGVRLEPARLVYNDGGTFRSDLNAQGIDALIAGMGLGIGDLDGDGVEELAIPGWKFNFLYQRKQGIWFDISQAWHYVPDASRTVGWGSEMLDVDNDGLLDITTAYGFLDTAFGNDNFLAQPDAMHVQRDGLLDEKSALGRFDDRGPHRSINHYDLDRDGWLDFVKVGLHGTGRVFLSRCGEAGWLTVELSQPAPNVDAVGATIRAFAGDRQWMRRVRAGGTGYGTGRGPEVHFGLGEVTLLDRLEITWPDGTLDTFDNVAADQHLFVERGVPAALP